MIVYTDHSTLKHLLSKKDARTTLVRWILLLQQFDCKVRDKNDSENLVADYLSRILYGIERESSILEGFLDKELYAVHFDPWYAEIMNYLVPDRISEGWTKNNGDKFFYLVKFFI